MKKRKETLQMTMPSPSVADGALRSVLASEARGGLLERLGEAVVVTDLSGRVALWNAAAASLFGRSFEEVSGLSLEEFMSFEGEGRAFARGLREARGEGRWSGESTVAGRDGVGISVLANLTLVVDDSGEEIGVIAVFVDVTERRRTEKELERSRARLAEAQKIARVGDWEWEVATGEIHWSDELYRIFGVETDSKVSLDDFRERVHPEEREFVRDVMANAFSNRAPFVYQMRIVRPDGEERVLETRGAVYTAGEGEGRESGRVHGVAQDITELRVAQEALKRSEERFRSLILHSSDVVTVVDREGVIEYESPAILHVLGYEPEERLGGDIFAHIHPEDVKSLRRLFAAARKTPDRTETAICRARHRDGLWRWLEVVGTNLLEDPAVGGYVINARDVTERKALEVRLQHQAFHDALTGLPNRALFEDRLKQAFKRTDRSDHKVAILFLDLNNFKVINDSLGHETGDRMLVEVSERLAGCLRPEDTIACFGGDEFVILLEDLHRHGEELQIARRLTAAFAHPYLVGGRELFTSASIGISTGDRRTKALAEDLLQEADTAMYRAKREGLGYRVFDPTMYEWAVSRMELENDLRRALAAEEFVVHYQPIANLPDRRVWGLEALVRWDHPERGLLNPSEFIPIIEESRMVVPFGEWILEEACRRARAWQDAFPRNPPLVISVNLSANQLNRHDLAEGVEAVLEKTGVEARCLNLDVTETVYVKILEENTFSLDHLRKLGVRISIDDFGVGYSSLAYLKRLPADILKIDKSFIRGLGEDVEDTAISEMVIHLAHTLGLEVVAEGVESEAQTENLQKMGCDFIQGFDFSEPLPPEDVPTFLRQRSGE